MAAGAAPRKALAATAASRRLDGSLLWPTSHRQNSRYATQLNIDDAAKTAATARMTTRTLQPGPISRVIRPLQAGRWTSCPLDSRITPRSQACSKPTTSPTQSALDRPSGRPADQHRVLTSGKPLPIVTARCQVRQVRDWRAFSPDQSERSLRDPVRPPNACPCHDDACRAWKVLLLSVIRMP